MSIQSTINQGLSLAALLATQNPGIKAKAEARSLKRQKDVLAKGVETAAGGNQPELAQSLIDKQADVAEKIFEVDPSEKTLKDFTGIEPSSTKGIQKRTTVFEADPEEIAQEQFKQYQKEQEVKSYLDLYKQSSQKAQESLQVAQETKRNARRNFLDYMKDEPTSFGVTIGELDPKIRKAVLADYSRSERKAIMDRKDAENEQK